MIERLKQQVADSLPRFEETAGVVPWAPRSILKSEGLAVCAMADLYGIDLLIESGICNGRSTEMWCRYFSRLYVWAIDWKFKPEAVRRLEPYESWCGYKGDARERLPELVSMASQNGSRIGVFIDGPKDDEAVTLAVRCMIHDNVQFVGVHDMATYQAGDLHAARYSIMETLHWSWATDAPWFVDLAYHLDTDESNLSEEQGCRWTPYCMNQVGKPPVPLGSYGPTIAFLAKELPA